jgi:Rrf2 family protein
MKSALNISEAYSLALHATAYMASQSKNRPISAHEMSSRLGVSEAHLSKVLQRLTRAGILRSSRGPGGGFSFSRPEGDITLLDIYESVEGPLKLADCLFETEICGRKRCIFDDLLPSVNEQFKEYLEKTTVESIRDVIGSD